MKFLKGLALGLLSFLLFLSLSTFGWVFMLNSTIVNPDFVIREVDKLDILALGEELLEEQVAQFGLPASYEPYVADILNSSLADLEPWMREQADYAVHTGYDYFLGKSRYLRLDISLEPVRQSLKDNLRETILASPPPELQGLPSAAVELALDEAYRQIDGQIPPSIEFDQTTLDQEAASQLEQVRQAIGYFQLGFKLLIAFILLLILGIVLLYREVRGASRSLGITFLTCGVFTYLDSLITKHFVGELIAEPTLPTPLQAWLPQVLADCLSPLEIYAIVVGVIGIALLVVSFVYRHGPPEV